jgi:predicted enzyme involved in methoxymalonyl-ACP biosynthesis
MKVSNETAEIIDFVLSCRVMGKKIENSILSFLIEKARSYGAKTIYAKYKLTKRNHPCKLFLDNSGLMQEKENLFSFDLSRDFKSSKSAKIDLI